MCRLTSCLLAVSWLLTVGACGGDDGSPVSDTGSPDASDAPDAEDTDAVESDGGDAEDDADTVADADAGETSDGDAGEDAETDAALPPLEWWIDDTIEPLADLEHPRFGTRPVAATREDGIVTSYIVDELVVAVDAGADLDEIVARWGGEILYDDAVPEPPVSLGITLSDEARQPTRVVVRVDPTLGDTERLGEDAAAAGLTGEIAFSDARLAGLWEIVVSERAAGNEVTPNIVFEPSLVSVHVATSEQAVWDPGVSGTTTDAFEYSVFDRHDQWSGSGVARAWQLLFARGWTETVDVAILDGGFWVEPDGTTGTATPGVHDFPERVVQWDFAGDDDNAGGENPGDCGGPCPWHGNDSASAATAEADNGYGAAGTGGWVARPWFFRIDYSGATHYAAMRTAIEWGADVVSMSYGGGCSAGCWYLYATDLLHWPNLANARGAVLVAAAGNDGLEVRDYGTQIPCAYTLCVGALDDLSNQRISYSNWGDHVDVFAPTNVPATPNPATGGLAHLAGGTSAAAPFVSGVVAIIRAVRPDIAHSEMESLLRRTARVDSPDALVTRRIDAYAALLDALEERLPDDGFEPDPGSAAAVDGGSSSPILLGGRTLSTGSDADWVRFTLEEWSEVEVELDFMPGLGPVSLSFVLGDNLPHVWGQTSVPRSDGADFAVPLLPPGDHYTRVEGGAPQAYDQWIRFADKPLVPDAFEFNDTYPTATPLPSTTQTHDLTLHTADDVDWFYFDVPAPQIGRTFVFSIVESTLPVEVRVASVADPGTVLYFEPVEHRARIDLTEGEYYVWVTTAGTPTRYAVSAGVRLNIPAIEDALTVPAGFGRLTPGDPITGWLLDDIEVLVFPRTDDTALFDTIVVDAIGIDATLYDAEAVLLDEGTPTADGFGEVMALPASPMEGLFVLALERIESVPEGASVPAIPYSVGLQRP